MSDALELGVRREGDVVLLLSPGVGAWTRAADEGHLLGPGAEAGVLRVLGREVRLRVPAGVQGRVVSPRPARVVHPVQHGEVLYRLAPIGGAEEASGGPAESTGAALGLVLPSPQSGRFYHRSGQDEPPLAPPGAELEDGGPVGLIEVMKTFAHVPYRAQGGLPQRARVVRVLAEDGAEVRRGDPLVEVEPA